LDTIFFSIIRINDIDINPDNGGKTRLWNVGLSLT
jgi:hypothetical protein